MQIYMTVNRLSGKFYIGKNKNCDEHYLGSGLLINRAINKYGRENFYKIILETVDSVELLNEREKHWIAYYRRLRAHLMYNISTGGEWGDAFTNHPDKELIRKSMSDSAKSKFQSAEYLEEHSKRMKIAMSNPEVRKKLSHNIKLAMSNPEVRKNMSAAQKLSKSNTEVRKKMSDSIKLKFQNAEYLEEHGKRSKLALSNPEVRKKMTDAKKLALANPEVRKNMSASAKAKFQNVEFLEEHRKRQKLTMSNPEVRKKISDASKAYGLKSCSIDGIIYNIINEAVHALGIKNREIRRRCKSEDYPTYFYTS